MEETTPQQLNEFVQIVDKFMANYAKLISPETKVAVYASNNPTLINDYENARAQGAILKRTIEATVGAWKAAKRSWASITDSTSVVIGDIVDEIRSWFGYEPAPGMEAYDVSPITGGTLGALGIIQLPAAAWVAGIVSAAFLLNAMMTKIFISVEALIIQKSNPNISRERALAMASDTYKINFLGKATLPLIAAGLLAAYLFFGKKT